MKLMQNSQYYNFILENISLNTCYAKIFTVSTHCWIMFQLCLVTQPEVEASALLRTPAVAESS